MTTDVTVAASQTALKDEERQSFENQAKEWQRKYTDLSSKTDALTAKIEELESKGNLSHADRERLEALESKRESIEEQKEVIRSDPKSRPWLSLHEDISTGTSKKIVSDSLYEYDKRLAQKMVIKTAKEMKVDIKEFEDGIAEILKGGRWKFDNKGNEQMPTDRVELAIEEWHRMNELKSDAEKGKKKFEAIEAERSGRRHETSSINKDGIAKAKETGNFQDILARKAEIQKEHYK